MYYERLLELESDLAQCTLREQAELLSVIADAHHHMHEYSRALVTRTAAWGLLNQARTTANPPSISAVLTLLTSLANDQRYMFDFDAALASARKALQVPKLPDSAAAVLMQMQSTILECKGDLVSSLQSFEVSLQKRGERQDVSDALQHIDLLQRTMNQEKEMPDAVRSSLQSRLQALEQAVITHGHWTRADQLPRKMVPGLLAAPWHNQSAFEHVTQSIHLLQTYHGELLNEFRSLDQQQLLERERECISDTAGGEWRRYEPTGYWNPPDVYKNCSSHTPVACSVIRRLKATGLPVIRAGYSSVSGRAHIKAHYGVTNAQLKLHLGLDVPQHADGRPCARFRVANETRHWEQGQVLFFDDSFNHEVWNECDRERTVFQVVFSHPDLDVAQQSKIFQAPR